VLARLPRPNRHLRKFAPPLCTGIIIEIIGSAGGIGLHKAWTKMADSVKESFLLRTIPTKFYVLTNLVKPAKKHRVYTVFL